MASPRWHSVGVLLAAAVVIAGPAVLLESRLVPDPWTARNVHARFESARYEGAALVFTYTIQNRTGRSAYLSPRATRIVARRGKDRPALGEPVVALPIELLPHRSQVVEVRLNLPHDEDLAAITSPEAASFESMIDRSLRGLDGFELIDDRSGLRVILPRAW